MNIDGPKILRCTCGDSAMLLAAYALEGSSNFSGGVALRTVKISFDGFLEGGSRAQLARKLKAARRELSAGGRDLIIMDADGDGPPDFKLLSAECLYGGPRVEFKIHRTPAPLIRRVSTVVRAAFEVEAPAIGPELAAEVFGAMSFTPAAAAGAGPVESLN